MELAKWRLETVLDFLRWTFSELWVCLTKRPKCRVSLTNQINFEKKKICFGDCENVGRLAERPDCHRQWVAVVAAVAVAVVPKQIQCPQNPPESYREAKLAVTAAQTNSLNQYLQPLPQALTLCFTHKTYFLDNVRIVKATLISQHLPTHATSPPNEPQDGPRIYWNNW